MKKTYFKKSLSVIMAVLMVMSCWVFVAPEHNHATAAMASQEGYASEVTGYVNIDPVIYVHGKYNEDANSDYAYMMDGSIIADGTVEGEMSTAVNSTKEIDSVVCVDTNATLTVTDGKLTGDLGDAYSGVGQTTTDKTATLKFTFSDKTFEYHKVSVLANPVAQHSVGGTMNMYYSSNLFSTTNKRRIAFFEVLAMGSTGQSSGGSYTYDGSSCYYDYTMNFPGMYAPYSDSYLINNESGNDSKLNRPLVPGITSDTITTNRIAGYHALTRINKEKNSATTTVISPSATYYLDLSSSNNNGVTYDSSNKTASVNLFISNIKASDNFKDCKPTYLYAIVNNNGSYVLNSTKGNIADTTQSDKSAFGSNTEAYGYATISHSVSGGDATITNQFNIAYQCATKDPYVRTIVCMPYQIKVVDYSALRTVYNNYVSKNLVAGAYTSSSWAKYTAALQKAELWLSCNADSTVSEYTAQTQDAVKTELENAYNGLVKRSYDLNYENLFSFSEWAASGSAMNAKKDMGTVNYDLQNGTITVTGNGDIYTCYGGSDSYYHVPVTAGEEYTFSYDVSTTGANTKQVHIFFYDDNGNAVAYDGSNNFKGDYNGNNMTFTVPNGCTQIDVRFGVTSGSSETAATFSNIALYSTARAEEIGLENWTNREYRKVFEYDELFPEANHYVPVRPGYTFNKWSVDLNGVGTVKEDLTTLSGVKNIRTSYVLYSNWTANKYTVKFDLKGGKGTADDITATYDLAFALHAAPTKTGYTFNGWNTKSDGTGTRYEAGATVNNLTTTNNATVTLYAQWLANDCNVTFKNEDDTTYTTANAKYDGTVTLPTTNPTKESDETNHYVFLGWYKGNTKWTNDTKVTDESLVLTAKYETVKHTITYTSYDTQHTATCSGCDWRKTEDHTGGAATCTKAKVCDVCKESYGNALGHDWDKTKAYNYENRQDGRHKYKCKNCEDFTYENHDWNDGVEDPKADCATTGTKTYTCKTNGCGATYTENVKAKGHDFTKENADSQYLKSAATCTSQAVYYKSCSVCGLSSEGQIGEATFASGETSEHTYTEEIESTRKPATCKATGSVEVKCKYCDAKTTVTLEIDQNNHVNTAHHAKVPATCINKGTIEYWSCSDCGKNFKDSDCKTEVTDLTIDIDAKNHTNTEDKAEQEPTCTDMGYEAGTYCKDCEKWISGHGEIAALGHDFSADNSRIQKLDGDKHNWQCSRCDAYGTGSGANAKVDGSVDCYDNAETRKIEGDVTNHKLVCDCGNEKTEKHEWKDWEADKANTDSAEGTMTNTCKDCGYVMTSKCNYEEDTTKYVPSTCKTQGHKTYVCKECGQGYSEVLSATGHKFGEEVKATEAGCENSGNYAYKQCETCKLYFADDAKENSTESKTDTSSFVIAAKGHNFTKENAESQYLKSAATCTEKAVYYKSCSACGKISQGTDKEATFEYGDALGHDWGGWTAVEDTDKHTRSCKRNCGETETKYHSWDDGVVTTPATCEDKGVTTYTCSVCNATKTEDIDPINHNYDYDNGVLIRPTQKDDGTWADGYYTYTCKNDSNHTTKKDAKRADYTEYDKALEKLNDLLNKDLTDEAKAEINKVINNQIAQDLIDSEQSKVNEATDKIKETIEKNNSSLKKYEVEFIVNGKTVSAQEIVSGEDATAPEVSGYHDETNHYTFSKWDKEFTNVTETITVTAEFTSEVHKFSYTQKDIEKHTAFCACGYSTDVEHNYGLTERKAANCTEKGSITYTCSACQQVNVVEIDALGHETTKTDAKDPTCTESGNWEYWTCSTCKKVFKDKDGKTETTVEDQTRAPLNHSDKVYHKAVDATCIEKGNIEYWSCLNCKKNFRDEECTIEVTDVTTEKDANKHVGDTETKKENEVAGTCIKEATWDEVTYCKSCGGELSSKPIKGLIDISNHVNTTDEAEKPATCEKPGHSAGKYCNDCKIWLTEVTETPALGHDYKYETFEPTCDKDGVCITTCKRTGCDYHKETVIEASGHDPIKSYVAATCNEYAHTLITCKNCDYTQKIYTGSSYGPHKWVTINEAVDATCTSEGRTACEKCVVCDKQIESEVIAKLPHADENGDGKCDSCGGAYVNNHVCGCICHKDSFIMRIIYAIARFFWRIFKINKTCSCGAVHY